MEPAPKAPALEQLLETLAGRTTAIHNQMCVAKPFGCGEPIGPFRDLLSAKEYTISGLCQTCQDSVFGTEESYEDDSIEFTMIEDRDE